MTTTESNKLIAEFMGYKTSELLYEELMIDKGFGFERPSFDKSWDWLMPVVKKIEELNHRKFLLRIGYDTCSIDFRDALRQPDKGFIFKRSVKPGNKMEAVYNAVVQFIQWYNQNK